jgi:hypothetical protein
MLYFDGANGGITMHNRAGNDTFTLENVSTNFGAAAQAGAFISLNSYFGEEFQRERAQITADTNQGWGDTQWLTTAETGTCTWDIIDSGVNGYSRQIATGANDACNNLMTTSGGGANSQFDADNLPYMVMKVRPDTTPAGALDNNHKFFIGIGDNTSATAPSTSAPANGIYFTNCSSTDQLTCGTGWYGVTRSGSTSTVVNCSQTIGTNFALLVAKVVANNDVEFWVDPDVTNGVSLSQCGTGSQTNIPTGALTAMMSSILLTDDGNDTFLDVDFYRVWQDDNTPSAQMASTPVADYAMNSNIAQFFPSDSLEDFADGTLMSYASGSAIPKVVPASISDQQIVGATVDMPGMVLNSGTFDGVRVATYGRSNVRVSDINGPIQVGDKITSSAIAGLGAKALFSGMIVGTAITGFDPANGVGTAAVCPADAPIGTLCGTIVVAVSPQSYDIGFSMISEDDPALELSTLNVSNLKELQVIQSITNGAVNYGFTQESMNRAFGTITQRNVPPYNDLIALLIKTAQEQQGSIESITDQLSSLTQTIVDLQNQTATSGGAMTEQSFVTLNDLENILGAATQSATLADTNTTQQFASVDTDLMAGMAIRFATGSAEPSIERVDNPYSSDIYGVVFAKTESSATVVTSGETTLIVSTANGPIKAGDVITTSDIAGVGQKSTQAGMAIGVAIESFDGTATSSALPLPTPVPALESTQSGSTASGSGSLQDLMERLANIIHGESAPKFGTVRVMVRPGFTMPPASCDMTDILCRSNYFANMTDPTGTSTSPFDGFISSGFVQDLVVYGSLVVSQLRMTDNIGRASIIAGTSSVTISKPSVTANSVIQVSFESNYEPATRYFVTKEPGIGFTISLDAAVAADSSLNWWILENGSGQSGIPIAPSPTPTPVITPSDTPTPTPVITPIDTPTPTPEVTPIDTPTPTP